MKRKKIAFCVATPLTARAFLANHISYLQKEYEVHLIANFLSDNNKQEFESTGVICHTIPIARNIHIGKDLKALTALYRLLKKEQFDSIQSVTPKAGLLTAMTGWLARTPHRIHIFTGQVWATRKGIMRMMLKGMDKIIVTLDTDIMVDGKGQRDFLIQQGVLSKENSFVPAEGSIAGVKLEEFDISETIRKEEREKFSIEADDVVYIFLGRLNHDKGIGELFEAFNKLVVECPKSKLLLYGYDEGDYDRKVDGFSHIKRDVNYFYPGPTKTAYKVLQAGDVFVIPTWREGFGVSIIEAQALALPVITSNVYGVVDASVEGVTGLRCGVNDPEGLYKCMKTYYDCPELRKAHGMAGRKRIEEHFDNKIVSQAWVDFYRGILQ